MREITDDGGRVWQPVAVESTVAHLKKGATLAFRPTDDPTAEPVRTAIAFNSMAAAEFAIGTMSEKDLKRRLEWAKTDAGIH
ncbi:MAG TPA: hypothetical protein VF746_30560 [Longimicrobium sp.]|jgi:hypothetical protein